VIDNICLFIYYTDAPIPAASSDDPFEPENQLLKRFLDAGVYLACGKGFQSEQLGWFRIIFAQKTEQFVEGLKR